MATAKIGTLVIRTLAKPLSSRIKQQAKEHERFRDICVSLAQSMYRTEVRLRTNILGEPAKAVRPLSEVKAIENGANLLAEGFLFTVAASLILGESFRSSRSATKRRDAVDEKIEELVRRVEGLEERVAEVSRVLEEGERREGRTERLEQVVQNVVMAGLKAGWSGMDGTPLKFVEGRQQQPQQRQSEAEDSITNSAPGTSVDTDLSSSSSS